jgi:hypothetical protein
MTVDAHRPLPRRQILRAAAITPALGLGFLAVGGCASRPPAAPPRPVSLLAVLPAAPAAVPQGSGFGARSPGVVAVPPAPRGASSSSGAAAVIGAGLIAAAIVYTVGESKRKEREALTDALADVNFDPLEQLNQRLCDSLEQNQVRIVRITDVHAAAELRAGRFDALPAGVDAILDVTVEESGFYSSSRAGGYSPMLHVVASMRSPTPESKPLDTFSYYADWREGGKDTRWVTTPKEMTFESVEKLKAGSSTARQGLEKVVEQFVVMMSQDVARHTAGQMRVD